MLYTYGGYDFEAPFIGIIRIRFTGYDLSRVSPGTPASTAKLLKKTKSTK